MSHGGGAACGIACSCLRWLTKTLSAGAFPPTSKTALPLGERARVAAVRTRKAPALGCDRGFENATSGLVRYAGTGTRLLVRGLKMVTAAGTAPWRRRDAPSRACPAIGRSESLAEPSCAVASGYMLHRNKRQEPCPNIFTVPKFRDAARRALRPAPLNPSPRGG